MPKRYLDKDSQRPIEPTAKGASGMTYGTSKGSSLGKDMARNLLGSGGSKGSMSMPSFGPSPAKGARAFFTKKGK